MSNNSSGRKLERFFTGKGFYIVLFLCAAVIGVSAWMMAAGNEAMNDVSEVNEINLDNARVETVIVPPVKEEAEELEIVSAETETAEAVEAVELESEPVVEEELPDTAEVWKEAESAESAAPVYIWPVSGELERGHDLENLTYDVTMRDWRTHGGIDINAALGTTVLACRAGTVESVTEDEFYGTVVVIDHGDGIKTVYANLADMPAVSVGDKVNASDVIGSVGTTALCEIGQGTHLHFAIEVNGISVDPLDYLPA